MSASWVWATYTDAPGAIELSGASNCSFIDVDVVPSINAGYLVSGSLGNLSIIGGLMDGNGSPSIHPGPGFLIAPGQYVRTALITGVKFWNLWGSAIDATDMRNASIVANLFSQNNRGDSSAPDIKMTGCKSNVISMNVFSAPDARTNKGAVYTEDAASGDNVIDLNTMEYNNGSHYYANPLVTISASSTLGSRNRPDVAWPLRTLKTITANYTVTKEDIFNEFLLLGNTTLTMTLPSVGSLHTGNEVKIKNVSAAGFVTVQTSSSQTIEGGPTSVVLAPGQSIVLTSDGTGWIMAGSRALAPAVITPPLAVLTPPSAAAWPAANLAILQRFSVPEARVYRYVNMVIDAASGNFQVAVVRLGGAGQTSYTRVMDSGVIAMPAAGNKHIDLGATLLLPGEYALAVWCDNTTATLRGAANGAVAATRLAAEITGATSGVPSSGTLAWSSSRFVYGATLEADI